MESGTKKKEMLFVLNKVSLLFYSYGRSGVRMSLFFYSSGGISDKVLFRGVTELKCGGKTTTWG